MSDELFLLTESNEENIETLDDENKKRAEKLLTENVDEKEEDD